MNNATTNNAATSNGNSNGYSRGSNTEFAQYLGFDKKFGHLNSVRVIPNSNPMAYGVRVGVPVGKGQFTRYLDFELSVASAEAFSLFTQYFDAINDEKTKATLRFSCSSVFPDGYIATSGDRKGEVISLLRGRLTNILNLKINGNMVYSFGNQNSQESTNDSDSSPKKQATPSSKSSAKKQSSGKETVGATR
jgi:hypothetical protein